ncbi:hypothetical protein ACSQ67_011399 [Phaseolus vulgaris]
MSEVCWLVAERRKEGGPRRCKYIQVTGVNMPELCGSTLGAAEASLQKKGIKVLSWLGWEWRAHWKKGRCWDSNVGCSSSMEYRYESAVDSMKVSLVDDGSESSRDLGFHRPSITKRSHQKRNGELRISRPHGLRLAIEDYPYVVVGLEIWNALNMWVRDYVSLYYSEDDAVQQDTELQTWWKEVVEKGHGDLKAAQWPKRKLRIAG